MVIGNESGDRTVWPGKDERAVHRESVGECCSVALGCAFSKALFFHSRCTRASICYSLALLNKMPVQIELVAQHASRLRAQLDSCYQGCFGSRALPAFLPTCGLTLLHWQARPTSCC